MRQRTGIALAVLLLGGAGLWLLRATQSSAPPVVKRAAHDDTSAPPPRPEPADTAATDAGTASVAHRPRVSPKAPPYATEDDYLRDLAQLNVTDQKRALELVELGDQWYPHSGLRTEAREAMRVTLLVDLGRMPEARAHTRRFIEEHPTSRYRPLVQGVTGIHPRPSGSVR